jgi:hypothetical protein
MVKFFEVDPRFAPKYKPPAGEARLDQLRLVRFSDGWVLAHHTTSGNNTETIVHGMIRDPFEGTKIRPKPGEKFVDFHSIFPDILYGITSIRLEFIKLAQRKEILAAVKKAEFRGNIKFSPHNRKS